MIALVDFGAGNLTSVRKAFAACGAEVTTVAHPVGLAAARAIVVPGVGHFDATRALDDEWRDAIAASAARGTRVLGICLGMQWLFDGSAEAPALRGLGLFAGTCTRLPAAEGLKVPHVGWNALRMLGRSPLLDGIAEGAYMYFTHAYAAPVTAACLAATSHGITFAAVVEAGGVAGVQFHPEKSGEAGRTLLRNFVRRARAG